HRILPSFPTRRSSDLRPTIPAKGVNAKDAEAAITCYGGNDVVGADPANAVVVAVGYEDSAVSGYGYVLLAVEPRLVRRATVAPRSEEHTSELQSRGHL